MEAFSRRKNYLQVGSWDVAYVETGSGKPLFLLHGCPFQSYEWSSVLPLLEPYYRVIAPDLLGLGDTRVGLDGDYSLPRQVEMVVGLMDALGISKAYFIGHDHGAATLQLMMKRYPERIEKAVLTNAEAYDQWPSQEERPYVAAIVNPLSSYVLRLALRFRTIQRLVFRSAVSDPKTLNKDVLQGFMRPHLASASRWQRLRRFFRGQLDPQNNVETMKAVEGLRRFTHPVLLLWGRQDEHFGPVIAERLAKDIPGAVGVTYLEHSAHLPMLEEPGAYADAVHAFLEG
jgi:pimeloyl-ACP methyl ester carboxylesterase